MAAVALAHGLNVNLLRKWLVGRGIKRTGLVAPRTVMRKLTNTDDASAPPLQFVPVEIVSAAGMVSAVEPKQAHSPAAEEIHVELTRGATQLSVRWPSAQAAALPGCANWPPRP